MSCTKCDSLVSLLICIFILDQKLALQSFQLWLVVVFLIELSFLNQNKTIFRNFVYYQKGREHEKSFSDNPALRNLEFRNVSMIYQGIISKLFGPVNIVRFLYFVPKCLSGIVSVSFKHQY